MQMREGGSGGDHLQAEEVAAYLDGKVDQEERRRITAHLSDCAECRTELIEVRRILRRRRGFRPLWVAAPVAAAAAVVVFVLLGTGIIELNGPSEEPLRSGPTTEIPAALVPRAPAERALVDPDSVTFIWRPADGATYRITLTDETGDVVWTQTTEDTIAPLPENLSLGAGRIYFWYVDALLADGHSLATPVRQFEVRR